MGEAVGKLVQMWGSSLRGSLFFFRFFTYPLGKQPSPGTPCIILEGTQHGGMACAGLEEQPSCRILPGGLFARLPQLPPLGLFTLLALLALLVLRLLCFLCLLCLRCFLSLLCFLRSLCLLCVRCLLCLLCASSASSACSACVAS